MNKLNRENMAIVCAAFLKTYCTNNPCCDDCPFLKKNGDCKLAGNYDGNSNSDYLVPEAWEVDSLDE